jgi:hypothetical protein
MNFIEAKKIILKEIKNLNIKHCGVPIDYKKNYSCKVCVREYLLHFSHDGIYLNLLESDNELNDFYISFVLSGSSCKGPEDISLDLDTFIEMLKLADFDEYIKKYNQYILFI